MYILSSDLGEANSPEDLNRHKQRWREYDEYIESVKDRMPESAFRFARAITRSDQENRAFHDSWIDYMAIHELASGERLQDRSLEIEIQLLGPYHDGHWVLNYRGVQSYSLTAPPGPERNSVGLGHGDWMLDEVRLSEHGLVLHEIEFSRGARWLVECRDIEWFWVKL